jgi:hypothetical protein
MIKLIVDPIVLTTLKRAMPKTKKAEDALEKYINKLQLHIDKSLMSDLGGLYRKTSLLYLSTHSLALDVGQFTIDGKKQYLHQWLEAHKVNLIYVKEVGEKNKNSSLIGLTNLVTINDAMDLQTLKKKSINELDQLLKDITLDDEDLYLRLFPDFVNPNKQYILAKYDFCPINIKSLEQFIYWASLRANKITDANRQLMLRQAEIILRVAKGGDGEFPMKKNPSPFGRTYYEATSVQSVHRKLREGMLGKCYEYDLRISVISWKMGFAKLCYQQMKTQNTFQQEFSACLDYIKDKKKFREQVRMETFGSSSHIDAELQINLVKEALTAISFGARMTTQGWINQSGEAFNPAIVKIFKDKQARDGFISSNFVRKLLAEQKVLDKFIYNFYTSNDPSLLTNPIFQSNSGRPNAKKIMSLLYQSAETKVMDIVAEEVKLLGKNVLARVHDAIFIDTKLSNYDRQNIEFKVRDITGIDYLAIDEEKLNGFRGVSALVKKEEAEQESLTAAQTLLAQKNLATI